ncbi:TRAP transporter large permease [Microbacterium aurantiacum]|uniref:TRAP transporter large permease n=2 Tax=Microbacterium aurantiacum TaxID=162393 RepID=A0ABT8FVP3_9MICO|nr:TRAP transporter large permease [Microbacterium aurantiacum]
MPKMAVGGIGLLLMLLLMAAGVSIGVAMIVASVVGLVALGGFRVAETSLQALMFDGVASWSLSVVPMFVLLGIAMWRGGITTKAYHAAHQWFGRLPGGLAIATNVAGAGLSATSGSTIGISFALGRMAIPEMLRAGYRPSLATGSVAMAGTLGQIIPPSILLVIYAGIAQVSVGPQLIAGVLPGVILALGFGLVIVAIALLRPNGAPRVPQPGVTWGSRFRSLVGVVPILIIVVTILGGTYSGIFTITEAAACGAFIAIIVSWSGLGRGKRGVKATFRYLRDVVMDTVGSVASLFLVLIGALLISRLIALSGLAQAFSTWLVDLELGRIELLLILILAYIVLGMFLESLPMMLLTVPLLQGPLEALGVDMIWFGIFLVILCEIGMVFPPIGILTFIVHRLSQDPRVNLGVEVKLVDVFKGTMPFVGFSVLTLVLFIFFPDIVMWLPEMSNQ